MITSLTGMTLKYNRHYIGLARDGVPDNFVQFRARKEHLVTEFRIPRSEEVSALLTDSGIDLLEYNNRWGRYRMRLTQNDIANHRDLLLDLNKACKRHSCTSRRVDASHASTGASNQGRAHEPIWLPRQFEPTTIGPNNVANFERNVESLE